MISRFKTKYWKEEIVPEIIKKIKKSFIAGYKAGKKCK
jgi:hypothetical protein